jgi:alcohol dehydrogenase class IV
MIFANIEKAYSNGNSYETRENMLYASYKAGIAFSMSYVGYIHAISHSISGRYGTPHGLANAVIMPYVLEGYGKSVYKKLYQLGLCAGVCNENDSYEVGAKKFIQAIKDLNARINIPNKIDRIDKKDIAKIIVHA